MKILIVEDEPKTGEYLRQGLSEAGYVADLVPHGTDGLHMALHGAYDLVILDVMLPGLNGWQVLQSLRDGRRRGRARDGGGQLGGQAATQGCSGVMILNIFGLWPAYSKRN